jgi:tetratricopeptide (TPR) repeat protein
MPNDLPGINVVLDFASLLPPDSIPWPWLQALVEREHPGLWDDVHNQLEPWLLPTETPQVALMDPAVSAGLRRQMDETERTRKMAQVRQHLVDVALKLKEAWRERTWELAPLQAAAAQWEQESRDAGYALVAGIVGEILTAQGRFDEAERLLLGSLEVRAAIYTENPSSTDAVRDGAIALERAADLMVRRGRPEDADRALAGYRRSLEMSEQLLQAAPQSVQALRDLSVSLEKLGSCLAERGQGAEALTCYERCLAVRRQLWQAAPGSAQAVRDLALITARLAAFLQDRGDAKGALALHHQALDLARELRRLSPSSIADGQILVRLLMHAAQALEAADEDEAAAECLTECLAALGRLVESGAELDPGMRELFTLLNQEIEE